MGLFNVDPESFGVGSSKLMQPSFSKHRIFFVNRTEGGPIDASEENLRFALFHKFTFAQEQPTDKGKVWGH